MSKSVTRFLSLSFAVALLFAAGGGTRAAESGFSLYIPGAAGDIIAAFSPEPGLQVSNGVLGVAGNVDAAVLQGAVDLDVGVDLVLDIIGAAYTFEKRVLGATYTVGVAIPFGYGDLNARLVGPLGGTIGVSDDSFALADVAFVPLQLNWELGKFHVKFAQSIFAPVGDYDKSARFNIGRNYWAFDTAMAFTWFDPQMGSEISVIPGIMFNTRNKATDYKTGTEFHVDFTANQFLSQTFAVGLRGYYYKQITDDTGSGAILGDFRSESLGLGPGIVWTPAFAGGKLSMVGKAMFDVFANNRLESDYYSLGAAWKF